MKVAWRTSPKPVAYPEALSAMEERVAKIRAGEAPELVWLLEHPPLYTAGTSARDEDLLEPKRLPVYRAGRGGQFTYHGPGQRVAYVMLDLRQRGQDARKFVRDLEEWVIRTLACLGVEGGRRDGRIGIWVTGQERRDQGLENREREDKIAAIGVRLRHWVSYHGIAINLNPDLAYFSGIVPCGIRESDEAPFGVTSLARLGRTTTMAELDAALKETFAEIFPSGMPGATH